MESLKALIEEAFILDPQSIQVLYFSGIVAAHEGNLNDAIKRVLAKSSLPYARRSS